jgi:hypothetical protein
VLLSRRLSQTRVGLGAVERSLAEEHARAVVVHGRVAGGGELDVRVDDDLDAAVSDADAA